MKDKISAAFFIVRILVVIFLIFAVGYRFGFDKAHEIYKDDYKRGLEAGEKIWKH